MRTNVVNLSEVNILQCVCIYRRAGTQTGSNLEFLETIKTSRHCFDILLLLFVLAALSPCPMNYFKVFSRAELINCRLLYCSAQPRGSCSSSCVCFFFLAKPFRMLPPNLFLHSIPGTQTVLTEAWGLGKASSQISEAWTGKHWAEESITVSGEDRWQLWSHLQRNWKGPTCFHLNIFFSNWIFIKGGGILQSLASFSFCTLLCFHIFS